MGHSTLSVEQVRSRLHARHDAALAATGARFTVETARRATPVGLTRTVWLRVTPGPRARWDLDTRSWRGARVEHRTWGDVEAEISAVLDRVAAGG